MTSDLFTVRPDDVIDLATSVMQWKHLRHVPVESEGGELLGIVTARELIGLRERLTREGTGDPVAVKAVMRRDFEQLPPDTPLREATRVLLGSDTGCLLIVERGKLLGIVTERDVVRAAAQLLEERR